MLHKSFKGGKCKTSLKLAVARIKLLRNKRNSQLIQMKRDLAKLLESGQEKTARIRVEHVVREEKTMAAYDLIDIYCELIVARLPIIESQKNCPIDLKEAITSVIFAAPRCADVPELLDVRKHFTAKYGKEFITAALELRPECGVNRTMVEKLSARAPDGETKMKILAAIAQEHNINWDPNVIAEEELNPPEDLLKGPATFVTSSKPAEAPTAHVSPTPGQKSESSVDTSEKISPLNAQDYASANAAFTMAKPNTTPLESRASESRREETEFRDSSSNDRNTMSFSRQHWNMEFTDATSAAQAAAESAERASMAARAAAELSSLGKYRRQSSTELHESSGYGLRDEGPGISTGPSLRGQRESVRMMNTQTGSSQNVDPKIQTQQRGRSDIHNQQGSAETMYDAQRHSSQNVDPRIQTHQRGRNEIHNQQGSAGSMHDSYDSINRRSRQPVSPGLTTTSIDDDMVDSGRREDRYQRRSSEEESNNTNRQGRNSGKDSLLREASRKKQPGFTTASIDDDMVDDDRREDRYQRRSSEEESDNTNRQGRNSGKDSLLREVSRKKQPGFTTASIDDDMVDNDRREDRYQRRSSEEESDNTNRQGRNSGKDSLLPEVSRKKQPGCTTASIDDDMVDNDRREDRYQRRSSEEESDNTNRQGRNSGKDSLLREVSRNKQPSQSHVEYIDQPQENKKTEYTGSSAEEKIRKQSSKSSSSLYRLNSDDDDDNILDSNIQNDRNYDHEHSFSNTGLGNVQKGTKQLSANDYHDVHFDGYGSEEDHVEAVYDIHDSGSFVPSPVRESPPHSSPTRSTRTSRQDRNESLEHDDASVQSNFFVESHSPSNFHETLAKSTMPSKSFDLLPATFDDSDGLSEEEIDNNKSSGRPFDDSDGLSEEEIDNYKSSGRTDTSRLPLEHDIFTRVPEPAQVESGYRSQKSSILEKETAKDSQKPRLYSSYDDLESEDRHTGTTPTIRRNVGGESVKRYSGHGSTKSSFTENEGTRTGRKSRLPSSSDDSESERANSLKNQSQLDGGGNARKKYGHDVLPFPNRTSQALRPNVGGESANSYKSHGSKKSFSTKEEAARTERKPRLPSSSDDSEPESVPLPSPRRSLRKSYQEPVFYQGIEERQTMKTSRIHSATEVQAKDEIYAPISTDDIKDSEPQSFSRAESGQGLNFGRLTGGIRNKVTSRRTFKREPSNDAAPPSRQQDVEYTPTINEKSTAFPKFKSSTIPQAQDQELRNQKQQKELRQELSSRSPRTFVDSDSDDDEVPPLRTFGSKGYTSGGLSRKQKDSPADSTSRLSTFSVGSDVSVTSSTALRRKDDSSVEQKTPKSMPQPEVSVRRDNPRLQKRNSPVEQQPSKPVPEPEVIEPVSIKTVPETATSVSIKTMPQPEVSVRRDNPRLQKRNPPVEQQPSKPVPEPEVIEPVSIKTVPETATSGTTNNSKPSLSKEGETSSENSFKNPGHVHPKLPDFESFTAHFKSLRSNRR